MPRVSRLFVIAIAFATTGLLGACHRNDGGQSGGAQSSRPPDVAFVTIQPQRTELTAELPGRTSPFAVSDVRPQVNGILKARLFTEGSLVQAGQPLYQIDDTLYAAALASAKAQLANAKAALTTARLKAERYTSLRKDKMISQQDYDDAQAALQQAEANVQQQEANVQTASINLGYTRITAPISGKISRSYLTQGALVTANQSQALATIQTLDPIYVDMNQSTSELIGLRRAMQAGRLETGEATVTLALEDNTRYSQTGTLKFQEVAVNETTGSVTLRAQFPNPDGVLLPGMFVRATIVEGVDENALLVPQRAVSRDEKGNPTTLIVDNEGVVQRRMLDVVQTVGSNWLVKNGIEPGDRVIVEGLQYARPGEKANAVAFRSPEQGNPANAPNAGTASAGGVAPTAK